MTTYGSYDAGLPCKNTACSSHGKPHPNCRCYGEMAEGGDVRFCTTSRPHEQGCEYFAEGGDTMPEGFTLEETPESVEANDELPAGYSLEEPERQPGQDSSFLAALEGGVKGALGPLAELAIRTAPVIVGGELVTPEARKARREENPGAYGAAEAATMIGGMMTGMGQAGAITKASEAMAGSKVLQSAIQGGLFQASDEVSKWILGESNPEDATGAVSSIGAAALFSGLMGGVGQAVAKGAGAGLNKIADAKFGSQALSFLHGIGSAAKSSDPEERALAEYLAKNAEGISMSAYKKGINWFDKLIPSSTGALGAVEGYREHGVEGLVPGFMTGAALGVGGRALTKLGGKYAAPALLRVLSSGKTVGAAEAFDHAANIVSGTKMIDRAVGSMFKPSPIATTQMLQVYGHDKLKKDLDTFLGNGGVTQSLQEELYDQGSPEEGYAEGGEVKKREKPKGEPKPLLRPDDGVAIHYPAQNMLLSAARGRVSNYLMGLRPVPHAPKLPFDDEPDNREQKKGYDRALTIAVSPLTVMHEIQKGTVEPEHIKHLTAMYPELSSLLQKKATAEILKAQVGGKKPPYKVRQGLSLLMGTALSGEMTPQSIQAAQSVFLKAAPPPQSDQPARKSGSGTNKLAKADQAFLTGPQAREKRAQRPS